MVDIVGAAILIPGESLVFIFGRRNQKANPRARRIVHHEVDKLYIGPKGVNANSSTGGRIRVRNLQPPKPPVCAADGELVLRGSRPLPRGPPPRVLPPNNPRRGGSRPPAGPPTPAP